MKAIKTTSVSALFAGLLILSVTCNAYADAASDSTVMRDNPGVAYSTEAGSGVTHRSYGTRIGNKLLRGLANVGTGIIEFPKAIRNTTNEPGSNFLFWGIAGGMVKGIVHFVGRTAVGVSDLITFPFPTTPMAYPDYPWQQFDVDTSYGNIYEYDDGDSVR